MANKLKTTSCLDFHNFVLARIFYYCPKMEMDQQKVNKTNDPANAIDRKEKVHSNDRKMKQDFPGYPHNPASEEVLKEGTNRRTDFSNESDTTATGSESVRGKRPTERDNKISGESEKEFLSGNDRGMMLHEEDPGDIENSDER
jgi:hypothetical protein